MYAPHLCTPRAMVYFSLYCNTMVLELHRVACYSYHGTRVRTRALEYTVYGRPSKLFHAVHGFVGWVRAGVKQGDPMANDTLRGCASGGIDDNVRATPPRRPERAASLTTSTCTGTGNS